MFKVSILIFSEKYDYCNHSLLKYKFEKVDNVTTCPADCI